MRMLHSILDSIDVSTKDSGNEDENVRMFLQHGIGTSYWLHFRKKKYDGWLEWGEKHDVSS
jgi:hypothetical protein